MARPKKTVRTIFKNIGIPEDLAKQVEAELYSEIEGKVPFGAQQAFYSKLLREYFDGKGNATLEIAGVDEELGQPARTSEALLGELENV
jgi:hypothetical protein